MNQAEPVPVQIQPKRDVWEKIGALSPLLCGVLISAVGTYCTYTYNQQQLKIQQVQTIGNFIPHLMGNEQSKKAAILALYTMTDSETASKFAQIFVSSGTVSALQSMSKTGTDKDKAIVNQALAGALQNLAQLDALSKMENDYEKKLVGLKDSGKNNSYTAYNMTKLAQIYIMRGQYDLAEPLLERSLALREKLYGHDNPEICDSLRSLAEVCFMTGRASKAEANIKEARAIEEKLALSGQSVAAGVSIKDDSQSEPATNSGKNKSDDTLVPVIKLNETVGDLDSDGKETIKDMSNQPGQTGIRLSGANPQG